MLMVARHRTPHRRDSLADPPPAVQVTVVEITVLPGPRGHELRDRIAGIRAVAWAGLIVGLAVVAAVGGVGWVVVGALHGGRTGAPSAAASSTATSSLSRIALPTSSNGPTTCTVYESGYATQVVFESKGFEVRAECGAWTHNNPGDGYLWGYEPLSAKAETAGSTQVCRLTDPQRNVTASVIQDTGFLAVSALERAHGSSACKTLLVIGWTERGGVPTTPTTSTSTTGRKQRRQGRAP
jgi:hypothetical protein